MKDLNILILGETGTGKSRSLKFLPPEKTFIIQVERKLLPFKEGLTAYTEVTKDNPKGNVFVSDDVDKILKVLKKLETTEHEYIIIEDFSYFMTNAFMRATDEGGFQKFSRIGNAAWRIMKAAKDHPKIITIISHSSTIDNKTSMKTQGKLVREQVVPEGLFTIVLYSYTEDGKYGFRTQNNGYNTCKSPEGMFEYEIENDLFSVIERIKEYYGITTKKENK